MYTAFKAGIRQILWGVFSSNPSPTRYVQVIANQIIIGLIAGMGCLVGGTLLLPSLATDELRMVLADIIQICGHSISGYASRIFPPEQVSNGQCCNFLVHVSLEVFSAMLARKQALLQHLIRGRFGDGNVEL